MSSPRWHLGQKDKNKPLLLKWKTLIFEKNTLFSSKNRGKL